jgi:hypothetical protein
MAESTRAPTNVQDQALAEVQAAYRHEMTEFEAGAWQRIIDAVPRERFLAFLSHFYSVSTFAPRPSDAAKALGLVQDPGVAFECLQREVRQVGPYSVPDIEDPVLVTCIQMLGGWMIVCRDLPDVSETFGVKQFKERFDACFNQALVQVRINRQLPTAPLVAIGQTQTAAQLAYQPHPQQQGQA